MNIARGRARYLADLELPELPHPPLGRYDERLLQALANGDQRMLAENPHNLSDLTAPHTADRTKPAAYQWTGSDRNRGSG